MHRYLGTRSAGAGLLFIILSLIPLWWLKYSAGPGVAALDFPLIPIAFMVFFVIGFLLSVISFVRGTLKRRILAAALAYAIVGMLSLGIIALRDIANGSLTANALLQEFTDIRYYLGLMVVCSIWPMFLVDVLGIFIIFRRL